MLAASDDEAAATGDGAAKRTFSVQQKSLHKALFESSEHRFEADCAPSAARGAVARTFHERKIASARAGIQNGSQLFHGPRRGVLDDVEFDEPGLDAGIAEDLEQGFGSAWIAGDHAELPVTLSREPRESVADAGEATAVVCLDVALPALALGRDLCPRSGFDAVGPFRSAPS